MKKTKIITESAVTVALAVICGFLRIYQMPQGGAVSLTMLPILILAFRRGAVPAIGAGAVYGLISLLFDGVIYHPLSILLDYVLAFGLVGLAGLFPKKLWGIVGGVCTGVFGRFVSSLISGAVLFAGYAPEGQNPWIYSAIYQATYLVPELIICVAVMVILNTTSCRIICGPH